MTDKFRQEPPQVDMHSSAKELADAWMHVASHAADLAHAKRQIYNAYIAEGFTKAQAIELIKAI